MANTVAGDISPAGAAGNERDAALNAQLELAVALEDPDAPAWAPRNARGKQISCDAMRVKIDKFLASGAMSQTAWLARIGVTYSSFQRFRRYKGAWKGCHNGTYSGAGNFFLEQRHAAKNIRRAGEAPAKRKIDTVGVSSNDDDNNNGKAVHPATTAGSGATPSKETCKSASVQLLQDVGATAVPGWTGKGPVFDPVYLVRMCVRPLVASSSSSAPWKARQRLAAST